MPWGHRLNMIKSQGTLISQLTWPRAKCKRAKEERKPSYFPFLVHRLVNNTVNSDMLETKCLVQFPRGSISQDNDVRILGQSLLRTARDNFDLELLKESFGFFTYFMQGSCIHFIVGKNA